MEAGAQKIVRGSGPDVPEEREAAKERFGEFLLRMDRELPSNVLLALEPTDRAIGKHSLYGPVAETASSIRKMRAAGLSRLGMLLDMGRVPLMGATLDSAVAKRTHSVWCLLNAAGYFREKDATVSFETRPVEEMDADDSLKRLVQAWQHAADQIAQGKKAA